ncbi:MAG: acyl-CoA thioesterase-1 [Methylophilaceae bacterium]|jgi:acyl-CoA thioesterase-1
MMRSRFNCLVYVFTAVSLLVSSLVTLPTVAKQTKPQAIVVFGDSLSAAYGMSQQEGWVSLLQQRLSQQKLNYGVINASISGETTSSGLSRFADMLKIQKPNIIVIELGGNDGLRGLSAVETSNNLEAMIQQAKKSNAKVLLLGMKIPPNYGLKYSRQFSANYQTLAKKYRIQLVPFFLQGIAGNPKLFQPDGLHPKAAAQAKLLRNVWPTLTKMLKD